MNMEKEELLQIIDILNNQVSQLNLENIILKTKLDKLSQQNKEE